MDNEDVEAPTVGRSGLMRAMTLITTLADHAPARLGVSALSRETGIPKAVAHRMLKELTSVDFVSFDESEKRYGLGGLAVFVGLAAMRGLDLNRIARPYLLELTAQTRETATLSVLEGRERLYVDQVRSPQEISMVVTLGPRYPLFAGASSRAILATFSEEELDDYLADVPLAPLTTETISEEARLRDELRRTRERGFAVSLGERQAGAASVAAAIFAADGKACGSISVSGPLGRFPSSVQERYGVLVHDVAVRISAELGYGHLPTTS